VSGLATDVGLVGLIDQVGAALPVADEPFEQRRAKIANLVHTFVAFQSTHSKQGVDEPDDLSVFAGRHSDRTQGSLHRKHTSYVYTDAGPTGP
jgi:tRNA(His) 5'-end guanylyltransferase